MNETPILNFREAKDTPKIRDLVLFFDFYRHLTAEKSAERAAQILRIQKSALYRKLDDLERQLCPGRQLVNRESGRAASTTKEGDRFFDQLKLLLSFYHDTVSKHRFGRPCVSIGATNAVITYILPMVLRYTNFLNRHPDTDINVVEGEWWDILQHLLNGRIDFGLGPGVPTGSKYIAEKLYDLRRVVMFHPDHGSFRDVDGAKPFDLDRLANETVLAVPEGVMPDFELDRFLPKPKPGVGRRILLPTLAQVAVWCKHDLGVGIGHEQLIVPGDEYDLLRKMVVSDLGETPAYLYCRKSGDRLSSLAEDLITAVRETSEAAKDWPRFSAHLTSRRTDSFGAAPNPKVRVHRHRKPK